jgi:tryptophan 2,3-dioxygenase
VRNVNSGKDDANWWDFSVDGRERGERIRDDLAAGTVEVNPDIDGLRLLSYHTYLGLDKLLTCQVPSSRAPDERIFIVTHQLFELVFKEMIFDLGVIAETFRSLLETDDREFSRLTGLTGEVGPDEAAGNFWRPASTAAARTRHGARKVIPELMTYLAGDDTFANEEFEKNFRDNLMPASGFQSAQFRLIQRAFGKSHLLAVRLFPADTYLKAYEGNSDEELVQIVLRSGHAGLVSVVDRLILREETAIATPSAGSPLAPVAELDDVAHEVLARIAMLGGAGGGECTPPLLSANENSGLGMELRFEARLREAVEKKKMAQNQPVTLTGDEQRMIEKRVEVFGRDWASAVAGENRRRDRYRLACRGAGFLMGEKREGPLASILGRLSDADNALSAKFLLFHQKVVAKRIGEVAGTAGGGVPYLDFSRELITLFPALVGYTAAEVK